LCKTRSELTGEGEGEQARTNQTEVAQNKIADGVILADDPSRDFRKTEPNTHERAGVASQTFGHHVTPGERRETGVVASACLVIVLFSNSKVNIQPGNFQALFVNSLHRSKHTTTGGSVDVKTGRPPMREGMPTETHSFSVWRYLWEAIEKAAKSEGVSTSEWLRNLTETECKKRGLIK